MAILDACAHHGGAEDLDDTASTSGSEAPGGDLIEQRDDVFGCDDTARTIYQRLVHYLSGGDGGMPHLGMENWGPMSLHLHGYLIALLGDGPNHKLALRQPSFIEVVQHLLLRAKHGVGTRLQRDFGVVLNPVTYTNKAGTFEGIVPTNILRAFAEDIEKRLLAMEALQKNPVAFVVTVAAGSLPLGEPGSEVQAMLAKVRRKIHVAATKKATLPKILAIIDKTIKQLGSVEPTGNLSTPVQEAILFPVPAAASAMAAAAGAIQTGGGNGKGKGRSTSKQPGAQPATAATPIEPADEGPPMPPGKRMCSQGSNCAGFGTMDGCFDWHRPEDVQVMREKRGSEFVSGQTRSLRLVYAMLAEKAAAPVPPTTQQPAAPQPVPAAAVTPETRAQQAAAHLARIKHAQNEFSGCALPVPIIPTTLGVSRTVLEHERIKRNQHIAAHVQPACC